MSDKRPESLYRRLDQLWDQGQQPDVHTFLIEAGVTSCEDLASALAVDQWRRWHNGERVPAEDYFARYPQVAADATAALALVHGEFLIREELDERPDPEEYFGRFPQWAELIRKQFVVHRAFADCTLSADSPSDAGERRPHAPARPLPRVAGYHVLAEVGRGGMGVVYKARHLRLRRTVALKFLVRAGATADPKEVKRFVREAELAARLQHPNVVQVHEIGTHDGLPFLCLEFVPGGSLAARVGGRAQPPAQAADVVEQLAAAVQHAHDHGVVHRDLKPENVLLAEDGTPKVTDFGLARPVARRAAGPAPPGGETLPETGPSALLTVSGAVIGTPPYMSPEQASGKVAEVGPAADVYGLGAVLYHLLTGRPPFVGETALDTLVQVLDTEPVPPRRLQPTVPRDLETIVLKCLDKNPAGRYGSAADLAADLGRYRAGKPVRARPLPAWVRAARWSRRRPAAAALLAVGTLGLLGLVVGLAWSNALAARRLARLRADVRQEADAGQQAFAREDWPGAKYHLALALDRVCDEPALQDLRPGLTGLHTEAVRRAETAEARRRADATHAEFLRWRDEALFHQIGSLSQGVLFTGLDVAASDRAAEAAARRALSLAGVSPDEAGPWRPDPAFTNAQMAEVTAGCQALLLTLAELTRRRDGGAGGAARALRVLDRAHGLGPLTQVALLRRADCLEHLGRWEEARAARERAAGLPRASDLDYFLAGLGRYRKGDLAGARRSLLAALEVGPRPDNFWAHCYLAVCDLHQRNWEMAAQRLTACLVLRPESTWSRLLRGLARQEAGDFDAAQRDYEQAERVLAARPDPEQRYLLHVNRGLLCLHRGDLAGAADDLERTIELRPDQYAGRLNLARVYQRQGRDADAAEQTRRALELGPPAVVLADHHAERARDLYLAGRYEACVAVCQLALAKRPEYPFALGVLGQALLKLGRDAEAADAFQRYLKSGGLRVADVYRGRGQARMRLGQYLAAVEDYTRALEHAPDAEAYLHRGWAYFFVDAWGLSLADFERSLLLSGAARASSLVAAATPPAACGPWAAVMFTAPPPAEGDAYAGRGLSRVMLGRWREAVADAEESRRRVPTTPEMMHNLACLYALAAPKAEGDLAEPERQALGRRYRVEAVRAVLATLALVPEAGRARFWREKVLPDDALKAIHDTPEFRELVARFGEAAPKNLGLRPLAPDGHLIALCGPPR
jgi:tetratricopeptide (TPR) repeat protein